MTRRRPAPDSGFTLPEVLISVAVFGMIAAALGAAFITTLRTVPDTSDRADSSISVQGLTTFLPPDVDSTEPGGFDVTPGAVSGCTGTDEGRNLVRMQWHEEFFGTTTNYVANYRYVSDVDGGTIVRYTCSGTTALGAPSVFEMSSKLSTTAPTITMFDGDGDGLEDQLTFTIETLSGEIVYIDAASKNPAETLPPNDTSPSTTTTSTTTTTIANAAPVAGPTTVTVNANTLTSFVLAASDPEGKALTTTFGSVPAGWTISASGVTVQLTAVAALPGTYPLTYTVTDPGGKSANSTLTVVVVTTAPPPTTTTSTTTSTTTTTLPPCIVTSVSATPNPVRLQANGTGKLKKTVTVTVIVSGGYCVGLTLQYVTGAPNGEYVQNLGDSPPYRVQLIGHPAGTELWKVGPHVLQVRDGFNRLLGQTTLTVSN